LNQFIVFYSISTFGFEKFCFHSDFDLFHKKSKIKPEAISSMLILFSACCQRVRVWLVALAGTKLVKENEPEENP
jgi:hypothetical protein